MEEYKYIVWVGGCDDYYKNYNDAKRDADEWRAKGYDDVIVLTSLLLGIFPCLSGEAMSIRFNDSSTMKLNPRFEFLNS